MKRVALHNLGCKVNAYETEAMGQLLKDAGYEIVPFDEALDACAVRGNRIVVKKQGGT